MLIQLPFFVSVPPGTIDEIEIVRHFLMGLPDHPKILTILSDWYEGETLPREPN